jgi:hypothetical protein
MIGREKKINEKGKKRVLRMSKASSSDGLLFFNNVLYLFV